jgi:putative transposase
MDEKHLKCPFYGVRSMWSWLKHDKGHDINIKRVRRLYRSMGLRAVCPQPDTSKPAPGHKKYPYLLRNLAVDRPNQVWSADITYIPMERGHLYLMAIVDVYSRYITGWSLSNTMTSDWCAETLKEAVKQHGKPEIINTDQGSQFTGEAFTDAVEALETTKLSMDGKGRAIDNIFIERLWRSLKYEHIYLNPASNGGECYKGISHWIEWYNNERRHMSINDNTPGQMYFGLVDDSIPVTISKTKHHLNSA